MKALQKFKKITAIIDSCKTLSHGKCALKIINNWHRSAPKNELKYVKKLYSILSRKSNLIINQI